MWFIFVTVWMGRAEPASCQQGCPSRKCSNVQPFWKAHWQTVWSVSCVWGACCVRLNVAKTILFTIFCTVSNQENVIKPLLCSAKCSYSLTRGVNLILAFEGTTTWSSNPKRDFKSSASTLLINNLSTCQLRNSTLHCNQIHVGNAHMDKYISCLCSG